MMSPRRLSVLVCSVLLLAACGRSGPPAPVEMRGIGSGETRPGAYSSASQTSPDSPSPVMGGTYTPPPGYGHSGSSSIQAQSLGAEPNDPYSQQGVAPQPGQIAPITPPQSTYPQSTYPQSTSPQPVGSSNGSIQGQQQLGQLSTAVPQQTTPQSAPANTMTQPTTPPQTANAATSQGTGDFGWPLRGRLISGFGPKPDGQKNEGLNIAAPLGTSVYASKDGTVAYAGNELRGFGNMVLVRHTAGKFTVYAHLDQISVNKGDSVHKGQVVGTVGQSGGMTEPQLHFEVRQGSTPQDPMQYLSR